MTGRVYSGINNIFDVHDQEGNSYECRIKGKVLKNSEDMYNPLAPGDLVEFEKNSAAGGLITGRLPRKNRLESWNRKRESSPVVACNLDLVLAVVSAGIPPFRPRFVDRVLIAAAQGGVEGAVLLNKIDQGVEDWVDERIAVWETLGIAVYRTSAETGEGVQNLKKALESKTVVLFGPSGVGKSSLLNILVPGHNLITGDVSQKHERGRHITNFGRMLDTDWGAHLIDTPGVREILVRGIDPVDLPRWFPEFEPFEEHCAFSPCSHRHEPDCAVQKAVEAELIHPDRYENYLRIRYELENEGFW